MNNFGGLRQTMQGQQQRQGGQGAMGQAINQILQAQQQGMQQMPGVQQGMPQMPGVQQGMPQMHSVRKNRWANRFNGWSAPDGTGRRYSVGGQPSTAADVAQSVAATNPIQQQSIPMQKPGFGGDIAGLMQQMQQMPGFQQGGQDNRRLQLLQMLMAMNQRVG